MNLRQIAASVCLFGASIASAAPISVTLSGTDPNYTGFFTMTKTVSGPFTDVFQVNFAGPSLVSGQLSSTFRLQNASVNQIAFYDVELDGIDLVLGSRSTGTSQINITNFARLLPTSDFNGFLLTVQGCAGLCNGQQAIGSTVRASYSGTLNVTRTVPEPGSLALALTSLVALGGVGVTARRRRL